MYEQENSTENTLLEEEVVAQVSTKVTEETKESDRPIISQLGLTLKALYEQENPTENTLLEEEVSIVTQVETKVTENAKIKTEKTTNQLNKKF